MWYFKTINVTSHALIFDPITCLVMFYPSVSPLGITCLQRIALYRIWMIFAFTAALISVSDVTLMIIQKSGSKVLTYINVELCCLRPTVASCPLCGLYTAIPSTPAWLKLKCWSIWPLKSAIQHCSNANPNTYSWLDNKRKHIYQLCGSNTLFYIVHNPKMGTIPLLKNITYITFKKNSKTEIPLNG